MKKVSLKKVSIVVAAVALVAIIAVGSTLAWFTDSKEAKNVVNFGNVKISLTEPNFKPTDDENNAIDNIVPGEKIAKDPTIENIGKNDSFVRAKIELGGTLLQVKSEAEILALLDIQTGWTLENGYYYFTEKLVKGDTAVLFTGFTIPTTWGNEVADKTLTITVKAQAVQSDNFSAVNNAQAWTGVMTEDSTDAQ